MPQVDLPRRPAAAGHGRVLIDTTSHPALVEEQTSTIEAWTGNGNPIEGATWKKLCKSTPCSVDLKNGAHVLRFTGLHDDAWGGMGEVTVSSETTAYRYALGHNNTRRGYQLIGLMSIFVGIPAGFIGGAVALLDHRTQPVTPAIAISGGALIVIGALLTVLFPYELQDGTGAQWTL